MNDAICRYRRRLEEESYRGVLSEEWFRIQQQSRYDQTRQELAQHILLQGRAQRARRWPDLRQQILLTRFGEFLIQDYDMSIQQLLLSGEVSCSWRSQGLAQSLRLGRGQEPAQSRDGQGQGQGELQQEPVPGNEDTLTWHA